MAKYRKKPIAIEAEQWFRHGDNPHIATKYCDIVIDCESDPCPECGRELGKHGLISTLEGARRVCPGDWIITGIKGERYPCKPDIFEATYEEGLDCEK